ncbi:MAG TPA: PEP-CTERM sorting domain-containing protein [Roseiarcus sp.]|nr:PEP-CTERM sorting domain-containing protein [Roseiarcus sp.]
MVDFATERSGGSIIKLEGLPGSTESFANSINNAGKVVGTSVVGGLSYAVEWSGGIITKLGGLPGSTESFATSINNVGQVVGFSDFVGGFEIATEWSDGSILNLGSLPLLDFRTGSLAFGINDSGQVVGLSFLIAPEPSTWAMMLVGFAGLAWAGYRRALRTA